MTPLRSFFLCSLVAACFIALYHILPLNIVQRLSSSMTSQPPQDSSSSKSKLAGFISRAELLPPSAFTPPPRTHIALIALLNSPVEHAGISLVLFIDHTLLSASGAYYKLAPTDYIALHALAQDITHRSIIPVPADSFRNTWRVKHERTGRPIDRFLVPKTVLGAVPKEEYESEFYEVGIYGWDRERKVLETPVGQYTELAPPLHEMGAVVTEARIGADGPRNEESLKKARDILGNVF